MSRDGIQSESAKCTCRASEVLLFPCSGGSNCGQIANQAAVRLTEQGIGTIYCLAGIGAHDRVMIDTARSAKRIIALDGCATACARRTLEHNGIPVTDWVCVTEEGIAKSHDFELPTEEIEAIVRRVRQAVVDSSSAKGKKR